MDIEAFRDTNIDQAPLDFLVRLDPSSDRSQALDALQRSFPSAVVNPIPHPDIKNLARVSYLPGLLAAVMGLLALATVIHALASSVRRRRRDLAVLKTLGFLPRQVSATVAWQAIAFATAAALAGLPLGIVAGRWAWQLVAVQLGVVYQPVVPLPLVLPVAAGTFVVAILVAAGPGWVASRIPPATVLRSE
jgi:predicted lysophospholipase L1 biosynthesis ABC-type transport system permease subunit